MWIHIVTVGASIAQRAVGLERDKVTTISRSGITNLRELEEAISGGLVDEERACSELCDFVSERPKERSAEINTCLDLLKTGYERGKTQHIYLLHTDTAIGRLCAKVLHAFFRRYSQKELDGRLGCAEPIEIKGLGDPERFREGLANLLETVATLIREHKEVGDTVFVHATGGFKPESAIALLAANLPGLGAPVFYIHEYFREVIRIPAMPVKLRAMRKFRGLMERLVRFTKLPKARLDEDFGADVVDEALRLGWAEQEDDYVRATRMGKLLWEKIAKLTRRTRR